MKNNRAITANWVGRKFVEFYSHDKSGAEIGRAAHNDYGVDAINIDYVKDANNGQQDKADYFSPVDIVAYADELPMIADSSQDFVFASHVLEHFPNPLGALTEWYRIVKDNGWIILAQPEKTRMWDIDRPITGLDITIDRHKRKFKSKSLPPHPPNGGSHWSVWTVGEFLKVVDWGNENELFNLEIDNCIDIITRNEFIVAYRVVKEVKNNE